MALRGYRAGVLALALLVAPPALRAGDGPVVLQDFDDPASAASFQAWNLRAARTEGGSLLLDGFTPVEGKDCVIRIGFEARDLRPFRAVAFRLSVPRAPMDMVVALRTAGGSRRLGTRLRLEKAGEQEVEVVLSRMDAEWDGLLAVVESVDILELRWAAAPGGPVTLDDLRGIPGDRGSESWYPSDEEWLALAFPDGGGKAAPGANFVLYTDLPEFQGGKASRIHAKLDEAVKLASSRLALPKPDVPRLPFFLFRDVARADAFAGRLGMLRHGKPKSGGTGFAAFDGVGFGVVALGDAPYFPHLIHLALHPWLSRSLRLRTGAEWVQESIIGMVGWKLNGDVWAKDPQHFRKVEAATFQRALKGESTNLLPLAELLKPENENPENLIEFASLGEFLAARHRKSLPKAWEALRSLESPDPVERLKVLAAALGTTPEEFEKDWMKWGASSWK